MKKEKIWERICELEERAKDRYLDNVDFFYCLQALRKDEQQEYFKLYKEYFGEEYPDKELVF